MTLRIVGRIDAGARAGVGAGCGGAAAAQPAQPATPRGRAQRRCAAPAEPYTYDPAGRRDPFVSLMARGIEPAHGQEGDRAWPGSQPAMWWCAACCRAAGRYVALVSGPDGKTYPAHANDRLLDGIIRSVTPQGIVIMQEVNDPLSLVKQREVRKGLRTAEDGK